jgi:hypothetical protein
MSEHRLSEIVIEHPRSGMRISLQKMKGFKKQLHQITEEASQEGLLSPYLIKPRNKSKYLSDHLGPLRRFLRAAKLIPSGSHVGQPWNNVYSKLCQRLDTSTIAGQHVLSHVWDYVERHVELINGIPYRKPYWFPTSRLDSYYRDQFYVHPITGILCASGKKSRKKKQTQFQNNVVILDEVHHYHRINEIWYFITFEEFPPLPTESVTDVIHGLIFRNQARIIKDRRVYAAKKRQCNKKEIRLIMRQLSKS